MKEVGQISINAVKLYFEPLLRLLYFFKKIRRFYSTFSKKISLSGDKDDFAILIKNRAPLEVFELSDYFKGLGWIEVICGGMFSGKTEELIRRASRAQIAGQNVVIVKPALDELYSESEVASHNKDDLPRLMVDTADQIYLLTSSAKVVCIDEAQFFDDRITEVVNDLANDGKRVIIAGLDMDYEGRPFEPMPQLMAIAEYVTKLHAICAESGMMANFSQRIVENEEPVLLGEKDAYEPRARHCFRPPVDIKKGKKSKPTEHDF